MISILIIDDDQALARSLEIQLKAEKHKVSVSHTVAEGMRKVGEVHPDMVLLDLNLPDDHGLTALPAILADHPKTAVVIMTGNTENSEVIKAMSNGAYNYLRKPLDLGELLDMAATVAAEKNKTTAVEQTSDDPPQPIAMEMIGSDRKIIEIHKQIGLLSRNRVTILINGESGTGKELVARIIHKASAPEHPFVAINCSAVVSTLLESELFGYEKEPSPVRTRRTSASWNLPARARSFSMK